MTTEIDFSKKVAKYEDLTWWYCITGSTIIYPEIKQRYDDIISKYKKQTNKLSRNDCEFYHGWNCAKLSVYRKLMKQQ